MIVILSVFLQASTANEVTSTCYGDTHQGRLKNSVQLPKVGANFKVYSQLGWHLGRTYVHSKVASVVLEAYNSLTESWADQRFVYGETGFANGGVFKPHRTHQNGLSVDFMVPVKDQTGSVAELPISMANKYGYEIEFNAEAKYANMVIDFAAMATHLKAIHEVAIKHNVGIKRVFFAPDLQPMLWATKDGEYLKRHITFNHNQAWVRHDEHYHVDFAVDCMPVGGY